MKDDIFKKVERMLYTYFEELNLLTILNKELEMLNEKYEEIEEQLRTNKFKYSIGEESHSQSFEERVQTSSSGTSYVEGSLLKYAEVLLDEQKKIINRQFKIDKRKRQLEINTFSITNILGTLPTEMENFIVYKYNEKRTMDEIALKINRGRTITFEFRKKIINELSRLLEDMLFLVNI